jgi:hypothetical protein
MEHWCSSVSGTAAGGDTCDPFHPAEKPQNQATTGHSKKMS